MRLLALGLLLLPGLLLSPALLAQIPADTSGTAGAAAAYTAAADTAAADTARGLAWQRLAVVGVPVAAAAGGTYLYFQHAWWRDEATRFHFDTGQDLRYARNLDKVAHLYGGGVSADVFARAFRWSGAAPRRAALYGAALSVAAHTVVEVKDGLSPNWGFSPYDLGAGVVGAFYPLAQTYSGFLAHSQLKFSYRRRDDLYFDNYRYATWINDYNNQTYWLSYNPDAALPPAAARLWPDFLAVAVGVGIDDHLYGSRQGTLEVFIALDVDVPRLLPSQSPLWEGVKHYLNYLKLPTPALRLTPRLRLYGAYW